MRRRAAPCSPAEEKHTDFVPNLAHRSYTGGLSHRPDTLLRPHNRKALPRGDLAAISGNGAGLRRHDRPVRCHPKRNGACQVGSSRTRSSTPPPARGTPRRWPNCSPRTTATSPTAAGSGSSFAARSGFLPSRSTRWQYRVDNRAGLRPEVGLHLVFVTSEALGDVGSSDVAVVVPKYRVFMNAGHAPTTIRDRSRDPRIPRAGLGSPRGSDQLCAASKARRGAGAQPRFPNFAWRA